MWCIMLLFNERRYAVLLVLRNQDDEIFKVVYACVCVWLFYGHGKYLRVLHVISHSIPLPYWWIVGFFFICFFAAISCCCKSYVLYLHTHITIKRNGQTGFWNCRFTCNNREEAIICMVLCKINRTVDIILLFVCLLKKNNKNNATRKTNWIKATNLKNITKGYWQRFTVF